jgi:hypothetical protein
MSLPIEAFTPHGAVCTHPGHEAPNAMLRQEVETEPLRRSERLSGQFDFDAEPAAALVDAVEVWPAAPRDPRTGANGELSDTRFRGVDQERTVEWIRCPVPGRACIFT